FRLFEEPPLGDWVSSRAVELRSSESVPLKSEAARIVVDWHEARHKADDRVRRAARSAFESPRFDLFVGFGADHEAQLAETSGARQNMHEVRIHQRWRTRRFGVIRRARRLSERNAVLAPPELEHREREQPLHV